MVEHVCAKLVILDASVFKISSGKKDKQRWKQYPLDSRCRG